MNSIDFYIKYPHFDWKFYISHYEDLAHANIRTEEAAIQHYIRFGERELRRTHEIVKQPTTLTIISLKDILKMTPQLQISNSLIHLRPQMRSKFKTKTYKYTQQPAIFFGVYNDLDIQRIYQHQNLAFIIWGGEDVNPTNRHSRQNVKEIKKISNCIHVDISDCIQKSLFKYNIEPIRIHMDLVDYTIFKPISCSHKMDTIFIYNGLSPGRETIYGFKFYSKVLEKLPQYKVIYSNALQLPNHEMPNIYQQCFIALRLTNHDGNANMVQECKAMNIPVVHNHSEYGLKWRNYKQIMEHILSHALE